MTADLNQLHPKIRPLCDRLLAELDDAGYRYRVTWTFRPPAVQDALPDTVTSVKSDKSKHCCTLDGKPAAKAFDLAFLDAKGQPINDGKYQGYQDAGEIWHEYAREFPWLRLRWGGDWVKPYDAGHFEIT